MEQELTTIKRGVKPNTKRAPYDTKKIETVTINFRVPKDDKEACKEYIRPLLKQFLNDRQNRPIQLHEVSTEA